MEMLAESLERLLANACSPAHLRRFHAGAPLRPLWSELVNLGYPDALVPEDSGGAGLGLFDVVEVLIALGRRLCPLPLGQTMVARAILAQARVDAPAGPIVLITPNAGPGGELSAAAIPLCLGAEHALLFLEGRQILVSLEAASVTAIAPGLSLAADVVWSRLPADAITLQQSSTSLRPTAAAVRAAAIAGMIVGLLNLSLAYTRTRQQFGRPVGEFQAVQQQLAVLAEEAAAAAMAAAIGCSSKTPLAAPADAAVAKMRTSEAAHRATALAHAVHGAIGITAEYDLQLFTRRLAEERLADGGEAYWAEEIGRLRFADEESSTVAFIRQAIGA
jgi:acyl-CoA dehydrogenase